MKYNDDYTTTKEDTAFNEFIYDLQKLKTADVISEIASSGLTDQEIAEVIRTIHINDSFVFESKIPQEQPAGVKIDGFHISIDNWKFKRERGQIYFSRLLSDFNERKVLKDEEMINFAHSINMTPKQQAFLNKFLRIN